MVKWQPLKIDFSTGIRLGQKLMGAGPLVEKLGGKLIKRIHPNCVNETYDSDKYWECYIRSNTLTIYHPVSTCRMGPDWDKNSVVDPKLRSVNVMTWQFMIDSSYPSLDKLDDNLT